MKSNVVISLIPGKVVAEIVDKNSEDPIVQRDLIEWKKDGLATSLEALISDFEETQPLRLMISDTFCHVVGLTVEKKKSSDREYIKKQVSDFIPEDLDIVEWDYVVKSMVEGKAELQVFAFSKILSDEFNEVADETKARIKLILPCSITLLESFAEKDESFLLVHNGQLNKVITAVINGVVKFSVTFNKKNVSKKILNSLTYLKKYLEFVPEQIVLSGNIDAALNKELKKNFKVVTAEIVPEVNLLEVARVSGPDQKVLNILFSNENKKTAGVLSKLEENIQEKQSSGSNKNVVFMITLLAIAILGIGLGYLFVSQVLT